MADNDCEFWDDLSDLEDNRQVQSAAGFDIDDLGHLLQPDQDAVAHVAADEVQVPNAQQVPAPLQIEYMVPLLFGPWLNPLVVSIRPGEDVFLKTSHAPLMTVRQWVIMSSTGSIRNPVLRLPPFSETGGGITTALQGEYGIIRINGQYVGSSLASMIFLLQGPNQSISGVAGGPMIAASNVEIIIGVFSHPIPSD